jgi:hypothetical protein
LQIDRGYNFTRMCTPHPVRVRASTSQISGVADWGDIANAESSKARLNAFISSSNLASNDS